MVWDDERKREMRTFIRGRTRVSSTQRGFSTPFVAEDEARAESKVPPKESWRERITITSCQPWRMSVVPPSVPTQRCTSTLLKRCHGKVEPRSLVHVFLGGLWIVRALHEEKLRDHRPTSVVMTLAVPCAGMASRVRCMFLHEAILAHRIPPPFPKINAAWHRQARAPPQQLHSFSPRSESTCPISLRDE